MRRLLLDTHVVIWALLNDSRLKPPARQQLLAANGEVWVSVVSIWEIAIKHALQGRADAMPFSAARGLEMIRNSGFQLLDMRPEHVIAVEKLPALHADPFDRLLIAQARVESMALMTSDETIAAYGQDVMHF